MIVLIAILVIIAVALVIIAVKGGINITFTKHIIEERKADPVQLEIAKANLKELERYNENAENAAKEQDEAVKNITDAIQDLMGVNNE